MQVDIIGMQRAVRNLGKTEFGDQTILCRCSKDDDARPGGRPQAKITCIAASTAVVPENTIVIGNGVQVPAERGIALGLRFAYCQK